MPGLGVWKELKSIGIVVSETVGDGRETDEVRYSISSLAVDAQQFAHAVRSHWSIENSCPWTLDMAFREDESRIREKCHRENMAWLNRLSLSLLKQHPGGDSVARKPRGCAWNEDFLLQFITGSTC